MCSLGYNTPKQLETTVELLSENGGRWLFELMNGLFSAREALRQCLPDQLRDATFGTCLQEDKSTNHWLAQLLKNLETTPGLPVGMSPLLAQ